MFHTPSSVNRMLDFANSTELAGNRSMSCFVARPQRLVQVSKEAWRKWLEHQKMLVNENRLHLAAAKATDARGTCGTLPGKI
jgi:hypothetical protein